MKTTETPGNAAEAQKSKKQNDATTTGIVRLDYIEPEIYKAEELVGSLDDLSNDTLIAAFKTVSKRINGLVIETRKSGLKLQLQRWLAGTMLNATKKKLGHGKFGRWRKESLQDAGIMSERTSQRCMELAEKYPDARAMLEQGSAASDEELAGDARAGSAGEQSKSKAGALLSSLSGLQKKLRGFESSGESFNEQEMDQLKLLKDELDRFFGKVLPEGDRNMDEKEGGEGS